MKRACKALIYVLLASGSAFSEEQPAVPMPSPLVTAISSGDISEISKFTDAKYINLADAVGFTPLMISASKENLTVVKLLVEKGADINLKDKYGFTVFDHLESRLSQLNEEKIAAARLDLSKSGMTKDQIDKMLGPNATLPITERAEKRERTVQILNYLRSLEKK
jgi:ankyrin repeat protein